MFFEEIITLTIEFFKTAGFILVFDRFIIEPFAITVEAIRLLGIFKTGFE